MGGAFPVVGAAFQPRQSRQESRSHKGVELAEVMTTPHFVISVFSAVSAVNDYSATEKLSLYFFCNLFPDHFMLDTVFVPLCMNLNNGGDTRID